MRSKALCTTEQRPGTSKCRLVIANQEWREVIRVAARSTESLMIGPTGFSAGVNADSVFVRSLQQVAPGDLQEWMLRWRDLICVQPQSEVEMNRLVRIVEQSGATRRHRLTLLAVGNGKSAGRIAGLRWSVDGQRRLDEIAIVAPGMPSWNLSGTEEHTVNAEPDTVVPDRWSRTAGALGADTWKLLRKQTVAIIGCGRSGSTAALMASLLGVRKLILVDQDQVETSNLDAMPGLRESDVGRSKAETVGEMVGRSRSDLAVTALRVSAANPLVWQHLKEADLIITTVDRDEPRWIAARVASLYLKPHLDIGTGILERAGERMMGADIRLLLPGEGCICCVGGLRQSEDAIYNLNRPAQHLERGVFKDWHEQRLGSLMTVNSTAIGVGLQLWLDLLDGRLSGTTWLQLKWSASGHPQFHAEPVNPMVSCPICEHRGLGDFILGQ